MTRTIWKFPIPAVDQFEMQMPAGAEILSVQIQNGHIQIWALVNPRNTNEARRFVLAGTGHVIEADNVAFIGTIQLESGTLIFHLFEIDRPKHGRPAPEGADIKSAPALPGPSRRAASSGGESDG